MEQIEKMGPLNRVCQKVMDSLAIDVVLKIAMVLDVIVKAADEVGISNLIGLFTSQIV